MREGGSGQVVFRKHRLNMNVDLQSLFWSMSRDVPSCTHWLSPRNPQNPPHLDSYYEGAIGQQR
jgi:hypothetical protein